MADVAILLNLTSRLTLEVTDPLMSIINASKPLLYYNRLSVIPFPTDTAICQQHVERLASSMRNLLEARSISFADDNETIRLIVTFDLARGAFQPEDKTKLFFPAQKAREFRNTIKKIFENNNPLLKRFEYVFLFLTSHHPDSQEDKFYQNLAYDGCFGSNGINWFCKDDINLNKLRDEIIEELDTPDEKWLLTHHDIKPTYDKFAKQLSKSISIVADNMEKAGLKDEFMVLVEEKTKDIKTVGDFNTFDYDGTIMSCVTQLIGLGADEFQKDCTFFILPKDNDTTQLRHKNEIYISSLVQLLSTLSHDDFKRILKTDERRSPARLFYIDSPSSEDIEKESFRHLERLIRESQRKIETARWQLDKKTVDYKRFAPKAQDPKTTDTHREINDKLTEERQSMYDDFVKIRKVSFFFGKHIGDWSWYKQVVKSAEGIFHYESVNDRPLYDLPKRITDNEMSQTTKECTYADLENDIITMTKETPIIKREKDYNDYLKERHELMEEFKGTIEKLKKEMVKLGYFTCLLWLGILATLGFFLVYSYHFFWYDNEDDPWLILAGLGATSLIFILSAIVGQACIKSKIKKVHKEMDSYYFKMQDNLQVYLNDISERVKLQNEADVRRKNLDEMKSKLDAFYSHNKQIDIWAEHFYSMSQKLSANIQSLKIVQDDSNNIDIDFDENDFEVDCTIPSLPDAIRNAFSNMSVVFSTKQIQINNITSFVRCFRFAEYDG